MTAIGVAVDLSHSLEYDWDCICLTGIFCVKHPAELVPERHSPKPSAQKARDHPSPGMPCTGYKGMIRTKSMHLGLPGVSEKEFSVAEVSALESLWKTRP